MERLCSLHNHPQSAFLTIHVAGTNGKGSVCTKIAAALQKEGYRTGLYTSPHISSFQERIQIGGELISQEDLVALFRKIEPKLPLQPTFFEMATLLAFLYFQQKRVDIAIVETGLGGRWDATNVITPLLSIITSIGYDHIDLLGPTLAHIAREKAGIIKKGVPLLLGPDVPYAILKKQADTLHSPVYQSSFQTADFDQENQAIAQTALHLLAHRFPLSEKSLLFGLQARPPCRFECHVLEKIVVFDVAHNAHGFGRLLQLVEHTYPRHAYRFVLGFSKSKDISACARLIQNKACAVHLVDSSHPRLAKVEELRPLFHHPHIYLEKSVHDGLQHALKASNSQPEIVLIAGSFFIMAEAKKSLDLE
jgi:dihydrofolate synthase/folylpolyglutamate synthase